MQNASSMREQWLLFLPQTPAQPSSLRVLVWRRLQQAGAVNLQAGAWILPLTANHEQVLQKLLAEVEQQGGGGFLLKAATFTEARHAQLIERFQHERAQEYQEFSEQGHAFLEEIEKETSTRKFTFAELEENEQDLLKLTRWLRKIQRRDFFPGSASQEAAATLTHCQQALRVFTSAVYAQAGLPIPPTEELVEIQEQEE